MSDEGPDSPAAVTYITDRVVRHAESGMKDVAVTLVVSGVVVTGSITTMRRYLRWERGAVSRTQFAGGEYDLPGGSPPYPDEWRRNDVDEFLAEFDSASRSFPYFCLADVAIYLPMTQQVMQPALLIVSAFDVGAFALGAVKGLGQIPNESP